MKLLTPMLFGDLELKNRVVMAPLTRNRALRDTVPHSLNATYYAQRASAGLIITEGCVVSPSGHGYPRTPGIYTDEQIAGWKLITDAVHAKGSKIFLQLWHTGRISHSITRGELPAGPSAIKPAGEIFTREGMKEFETPRELTAIEIDDIAKQYFIAASNAMTAGFDGVEVHAANGYLLDQFMRDKTNQRNDQYGGSVENRLRLLSLVLSHVILACDAKRVGLHISPTHQHNDINDSNPQELFECVAALAESFNLNYLHVVEDRTSNFQYQCLHDIFSGNYIANGAYDLDTAREAVDSDHADLVSFGKLYISNPDLVERFEQNAPLNAWDEATFYMGSKRGYTDYPMLDQIS